MKKKSELSNQPIDTLLAEVLRRKGELLTDDGLLTDKSFALADFLGTRVAVDGVAVRHNDKEQPELMAIRRNTGPYAGKLCLVGGGIGRINEAGAWLPESIDEALKRHFKTDLGYDISPVGSWDAPHYVAQDMRPIEGVVRPGFMPNPNSRHLLASRYLVTLNNPTERPVFGSTSVGGQEAADIEWFTKSEMPGHDDFGYNHGQTYDHMFNVASKLSPEDTQK